MPLLDEAEIRIQKIVARKAAVLRRLARKHNQSALVNKPFPDKRALLFEWKIAARTLLQLSAVSRAELSEFRSTLRRLPGTTTCARSNARAARVSYASLNSAVAHPCVESGDVRPVVSRQLRAPFTEPAGTSLSD